MPDSEKEKIGGGGSLDGSPASAPALTKAAGEKNPGGEKSGAATVVEETATSQYFFGEPLVGFDPSEITGQLVVIEGMDGSGRSTQIALLQEWLESEGFSVQTSGLRRSNLVGRDIDEL